MSLVERSRQDLVAFRGLRCGCRAEISLNPGRSRTAVLAFGSFLGRAECGGTMLALSRASESARMKCSKCGEVKRKITRELG